MSSLIRNVKNLNIPVINYIPKKATPSLSSIEYAHINLPNSERPKSNCTSRSKSLPPIPIPLNALDPPYKSHLAQEVLIGCGSAIRKLIVTPQLVPPTFKIMAKRWFSQKSKYKGKGVCSDYHINKKKRRSVIRDVVNSIPSIKPHQDNKKEKAMLFRDVMEDNMVKAQTKRSLHLLKQANMPSTSYQMDLKENTMSSRKKSPKDRCKTIKDILNLNEEVKTKKYKESLVVKQAKNKVTFHYLSPRRDCTQCLSKNRKRLLDFYKKNAYQIGNHSQKKRYLSYYSKNNTEPEIEEKEKIIVKDQNINDGLQDKSLSLFNLVKYQTASSHEFVPTNRYKFEAKQRPDVYKVIEEKEKKREDPYPLEMFNDDFTSRDLETARSMAPKPKTVFEYYTDTAITNLPAAADNLEYDMVGCPDCGSGKKETPCKINVNKKKKKDDKCKKPKKDPPCTKRNPCDQGPKDYRASPVNAVPMEVCPRKLSDLNSNKSYLSFNKPYDTKDNTNKKYSIGNNTTHKNCTSFSGHSMAQLRSINKNVYFTEDLFNQKSFLDNMKKVNSSHYLDICKMDKVNNLKQQQKVTSANDDDVYFIHPKDDLNERLNNAFGSTPRVEINEKSKDMIAKAIKKTIQPIIEKEFLKYDEVKEAVERMEKNLDNCLKALSKSLHVPVASPLSMISQNQQSMQLKYSRLKHHQEPIIDKNERPEIIDPARNRLEYKDPRKISSVGIPVDSPADDYKEPENDNLGMSFKKFNHQTGTASKIKIAGTQKSINLINIVAFKKAKFICKSKDANRQEQLCSKKADGKSDSTKDSCKPKTEDPCKKKEDPCKKKEDPCKKKEDPCKKKEDPCKKKEDPCKKKEDPCKKKEDPCKKNEDPCKKKEDPCKKKEDHCKKKEDPCKKKEDPCKPKEDPCKKKEDPCKPKEDHCKKKEDPCKPKEDPCKKKEDPCKPKEDPCKKKEDPCKKQEDPCKKKDSSYAKADSINDKCIKEDPCKKDEPCKKVDPCKTTCDPCDPIETERIDPCSNFCNQKEDTCSLPEKDTCPEPSHLDACGELAGGEVQCRKSKVAEKECCRAPPTCTTENQFHQEEIKCGKITTPKIKLPLQPEACQNMSDCKNVPMPETCPLKPECKHKCPEVECPTCLQLPCTAKPELLQKSETSKIQPCSRPATEHGFPGIRELAKCDYTKNAPCSSCEIIKPSAEAFIQINPKIIKPVIKKQQKLETPVSEMDRRYCSKETLVRKMDEISRLQALDESRKKEQEMVCKKPVLFGESSRKSWNPVKIQHKKMGDLKTIPGTVKTEKPELKKSKSHETCTEAHKNKGIVETCSNKITDLCMMIIRKHKGGKKAAPIVVTLSRSEPNLSRINQIDGPGLLFDGGSSGQNGNGNKYDCGPFGLFGSVDKKSGKRGKSKEENFLKLRDDCNNIKQNKTKNSHACKKSKSEPSIKCKNDKHNAEEEDPYNCVKRKRSKANKNEEKSEDKKNSKQSGKDHCKKKDDHSKKKEDPCKKKEDPSKKKEDPCKKKEDPCKKKEDPCKRKEDPCKKKEDPCKKKEDPCKKKEDPCKKKEDPCKKKEDPCKKKEDPCKKKEDPCKKKEDPCKKKEDPCKKKEDPNKKKEDPCKKKEDPCKKKETHCTAKKDDKEKEDKCKEVSVKKCANNPENDNDPCKLREDPCRSSKKGDHRTHEKNAHKKKQVVICKKDINQGKTMDSCKKTKNEEDVCKKAKLKDDHCKKLKPSDDPCKSPEADDNDKQCKAETIDCSEASKKECKDPCNKPIKKVVCGKRNKYPWNRYCKKKKEKKSAKENSRESKKDICLPKKTQTCRTQEKLLNKMKKCDKEKHETIEDGSKDGHKNNVQDVCKAQCSKKNTGSHKSRNKDCKTKHDSNVKMKKSKHKKNDQAKNKKKCLPFWGVRSIGDKKPKSVQRCSAVDEKILNVGIKEDDALRKLTSIQECMVILKSRSLALNSLTGLSKSNSMRLFHISSLFQKADEDSSFGDSHPKSAMDLFPNRKKIDNYIGIKHYCLIKNSKELNSNKINSNSEPPEEENKCNQITALKYHGPLKNNNEMKADTAKKDLTENDVKIIEKCSKEEIQGKLKDKIIPCMQKKILMSCNIKKKSSWCDQNKGKMIGKEVYVKQKINTQHTSKAEIGCKVGIKEPEDPYNCIKKENSKVCKEKIGQTVSKKQSKTYENCIKSEMQSVKGHNEPNKIKSYTLYTNDIKSDNSQIIVKENIVLKLPSSKKCTKVNHINLEKTCQQNKKQINEKDIVDFKKANICEHITDVFNKKLKVVDPKIDYNLKSETNIRRKSNEECKLKEESRSCNNINEVKMKLSKKKGSNNNERDYHGTKWDKSKCSDYQSKQDHSDVPEESKKKDNNERKCSENSFKICPDQPMKDMGLLRQCALMAKKSKDQNKSEKSKYSNIKSKENHCSTDKISACKKDDSGLNDLKDLTESCVDNSGEPVKDMGLLNSAIIEDCSDKQLKEHNCDLDEESNKNQNALEDLKNVLDRCGENAGKPLKDMGLFRQCGLLAKNQCGNNKMKELKYSDKKSKEDHCNLDEKSSYIKDNTHKDSATCIVNAMKKSKNHCNKTESKKVKCLGYEAKTDCCTIDKKSSCRKDQSIQKGLKDLTNMLPGICEEPLKDMGILSQCTMMTRKSKYPIIEPISDENARDLFCCGEETIIFQVKKLGTGEKLVCVGDITEQDLEENLCQAQYAKDVKRLLKCTIVKDTNNKEKLICMPMNPETDENEDCPSTQNKIKITSNKLVCRKIMSYKDGVCEPEIVCQIMQVEEIKLANENDKDKTIEKLLTYKDLIKKKKNGKRNASKTIKNPDEENKNEICNNKDESKNETKEDECQ